jgi:TRAP-type C4-dicarboxylate transport system substrate-binding protein
MIRFSRYRSLRSLGAGVTLLALAAAPFLNSPPPAAAQAAGKVVKLATLVPEGSVWHKILRDMGSQWNTGTAGRVTLKIYPGGVAGDEPDMVRKMQIGQIQAAALTVAGLAAIDNSFEAFAVPMMFNSYPELFYVLRKMEPTLKAKLEAKGYVLLNWGHGGWVYFFSQKPISSLADLKKAKMFIWAGDDKMVQLWKATGFQPVPLAATDILPSLQTKMIDALPTTPLAANSLQWFRATPYMANAGLGPLIGGLVIRKTDWQKLSDADRATIQAACLKAEKLLENQVPAQDSSSVVQMSQRGLTVVAVKPAELAEWRKTADDFASRMRGGMVPPEIMDQALRERDAFRKGAH